MVHYALEAAESLMNEKGISVEVIDLRTLLPLDEDTMRASLEKTRRLVVVTESNRTAGASAELYARAHELVPGMRSVLRVAGKDTIIACSPGLEQYSVPSVGEIKDAVVKAASPAT